MIIPLFYACYLHDAPLGCDEKLETEGSYDVIEAEKVNEDVDRNDY